MKNIDSNTVRTSANSLFPNWDTTLGLLWIRAPERDGDDDDDDDDSFCDSGDNDDNDDDKYYDGYGDDDSGDDDGNRDNYNKYYN